MNRRKAIVIVGLVDAITICRRKQILQANRAKTKILGTNEQSFMELNAALFPTPVVQFFPGCGITESHILKLEGEDRISRRDGKISRLD